MPAALDPYLYPGTAVLRNLPGLRDQASLDAYEALHTGARLFELATQQVIGSFRADARYLKAIHRHLFQDVYPWAGNFRTTPLAKAQ